jgi:antitoxin component YwqK of YwqJK toxin-antitoxin module
MKLKSFLAALAAAFLFVSCGGSDCDCEALKKENEQLKQELQKARAMARKALSKKPMLGDRRGKAMKGRMSRGERFLRREDGKLEIPEETKRKMAERRAARTSKHVSWYPNGQVREEMEVNAEDDRHGLYTAYYPSGQKKEEGRYQNNKKHGKWTRWDDQGRVVDEVEYVDGVRQEKEE